MAFQSYFDSLPFNGYFDGGMPTFPMGGAYGAVPVQRPTLRAALAPPMPEGGGGTAPGGSVPIPLGTPQNAPPVPPAQDSSGLGLDLIGTPQIAPPAPNVQPMVSSWESGVGIPDSGPMVGGYGPVGTPSVSASESGVGIPDGAAGGFQATAPNISGGYQFSPADLSSMSKTPSLPYYSSLTNTPTFNTGNLEQAGVNIASNFVPGIGILAGIGQGFNIFGEASNTGNPITDALGTAGPLQSTTADIANWINRQFGGTHMPDYVPPSAAGAAASAPMGAPGSPGGGWGGQPGTYAQQQGLQNFGYGFGYNPSSSTPAIGYFDISGGGGGVGESNNPNRLML